MNVLTHIRQHMNAIGGEIIEETENGESFTLTFRLEDAFVTFSGNTEDLAGQVNITKSSGESIYLGETGKSIIQLLSEAIESVYA